MNVENITVWGLGWVRVEGPICHILPEGNTLATGWGGVGPREGGLLERVVCDVCIR